MPGADSTSPLYNGFPADLMCSADHAASMQRLLFRPCRAQPNKVLLLMASVMYISLLSLQPTAATAPAADRGELLCRPWAALHLEISVLPIASLHFEQKALTKSLERDMREWHAGFPFAAARTASGRQALAFSTSSGGTSPSPGMPQPPASMPPHPCITATGRSTALHTTTKPALSTAGPVSNHLRASAKLAALSQPACGALQTIHPCLLSHAD